jgi:hypothetical protein
MRLAGWAGYIMDKTITTPQEMIDHLQRAKFVTVDEHICDAIIAFIKEHSDAKDD